MTQLNADRAFRVSLEEVAKSPVGEASARRDASFGLLELIPVRGVVEEIGEVREQVQAVVQQEAGCAKRRWTARALELGGDGSADSSCRRRCRRSVRTAESGRSATARSGT